MNAIDGTSQVMLTAVALVMLFSTGTGAIGSAGPVLGD